MFPYDDRLKLLPAYLQQLVMESLGKSVRLDGTPVAERTVPVWWGGAGTDAQHSFFQALHQGTDIVPGDFIGVRAGRPSACAKTIARCSPTCSRRPKRSPTGRTTTIRIVAIAGNRPSTLLLLDALTPRSLGALIALYEHSVYLQSVLWGINAFDQFGVELGKQVASTLAAGVARAEGRRSRDPVTQRVARTRSCAD